jgi:hypothetical protein
MGIIGTMDNRNGMMDNRNGMTDNRKGCPYKGGQPKWLSTTVHSLKTEQITSSTASYGHRPQQCQPHLRMP